MSGQGPDFFAIGPAKSGTSWLLHHLGRHPQVRRPWVKNINFFDAADLHTFVADARRLTTHRNYGNYFDLYDGSNLAGFEHVVKLRRTIRTENFLRDARVALRERNTGGLLHIVKCWSLPRQLTQDHVDRYRRWLFESAPGKISGDLSTNNFTLSRRAIELIARTSPNLRVIMGIRNPIERRWSFLRMDHVLRGGSGGPPVFDLSELRRPDPEGDYRGAISNWTEFFPPGQIHFAFFDELRANPFQYLQGIYDFLGIAFAPGMVDLTPRQKGIDWPLSDEAERTLRERSGEQIQFLKSYFPNNPHVQSWS